MKNYILTGLVALGLLTIGCSENQIGIEELNEIPDEGNAVLYISLQGNQDPTRAIGTDNDQYESSVFSFAAYVFNSSNGYLEAKREFTNGATSGEIDGLGTVTNKDIVVLVNYPVPYPDGNDYTSLINTELDLSTQDPANIQSYGLFMSGDTLGVTLTEEGPNAITVNVGRIVAKVKLMSLIVNPSTALIDDFELTGVSMQRVRNTTNLYGDLLPTGGFEYVGGFQTDSSGLTPVPYLNEQFSLPTNYNVGDNIFTTDAEIPYFYIFPNDNTNDSSTLISIQGIYQNEVKYFSYMINNEVLSDGLSDMDGEWIKSNTIYNIYFTLDKIEHGGDDPNSPNILVTATLVVNVLGWENTIVQYINY